MPLNTGWEVVGDRGIEPAPYTLIWGYHGAIRPVRTPVLSPLNSGSGGRTRTG